MKFLGIEPENAKKVGDELKNVKTARKVIKEREKKKKKT